MAHESRALAKFAAELQYDDMPPHVIERALDRIAASGVAMELNTSGVQKDLPEMNPSPSQLALMHERGIPVVIGADAHVPERVGDGYITALGLLENAGYQEVSFFIDRKRQSVRIQDAMESLPK